VKGGSLERGVGESDVLDALRAELQSLASWLGLEAVTFASRRGSLMKALRTR